MWEFQSEGCAAERESATRSVSRRWIVCRQGWCRPTTPISIPLPPQNPLHNTCCCSSALSRSMQTAGHSDWMQCIWSIPVLTASVCVCDSTFVDLDFAERPAALQDRWQGGIEFLLLWAHAWLLTIGTYIFFMDRFSGKCSDIS
jgi:hypothetical protein